MFRNFVKNVQETVSTSDEIQSITFFSIIHFWFNNLKWVTNFKILNVVFHVFKVFKERQLDKDWLNGTIMA